MEKLTFKTFSNRFKSTLLGNRKLKKSNKFHSRYRIDCYWIDSQKQIFTEFMYQSYPNHFIISFCPYDSALLTEGREENIQLKEYKEQRIIFSRMFGV